MNSAVVAAVKAYFADTGIEIDEDTPLLERELIDSMGILELVAYLEKTLKTPVDQSMITAKTFASARSIADALEAPARHE